MKRHNCDSALPLEGLVVLDLTRLLPGPLCTMLMGDYGAEVIKIEDLEAGDPTRFVGRFLEGSGTFFRVLNRNKKSFAVNLKTEAGCKILKELAGRADVLVEGFRPGVMDRLGLGYESLAEINPRLVYASISGYGQEGPYRERAGHDINYAALSGLLDLSAAEGSAPRVPTAQVADIAGGSLMALNGIMMALYKRQESGRGSFIDIPMTRGLLPWLTYAASGYNDDGNLPGYGRGHITGGYACYNIYETADGRHMSLGALEPVFWQRFCEAAGRPQWAELQFEDRNQKQLISEVRALFKEKTRAQWEEFFSNLDACCEPVLNLEEAIGHPVSREGGYWLKTRHETGETELTPGFPLLFSGREGERRLPPPRHGEHTGEILRDIGYTDNTIKSLAAKGVISQAAGER